MNKITELSKLINNNWQKICTSEDWTKKEFKYVLEEIFNNNASYHRKQWEFVAIFLCLCQQGKLHKNANGASFGAGKEPLIYHLLPFVESFLATDLYSWATGWETAKMGKTDTPMDFLQRNAPNNLDISNLHAKEMDMRTLDIEDNSLDFCYSSCAVEHIGHRGDFIQHLKEVKRVLKDDGIYVMTTEFLFNHKTFANKGNYKFDIDYIKALISDSGLEAQYTFDAGCEENRLNVPRAFVRPLVGGKSMEKLLPAAAILDIEGVAYTSCCFILSSPKDAQINTFEVNGLEQSSSFIQKRLKHNINNLYAEKRSLDPFYSLNNNSRLFLDDHIQFRAKEDKNNNLIKLNKANFCFTDFISFNDKHATFVIDYELNNFAGRVNWFLVEKQPMQIKGRTKLQSLYVKHKKDSKNQYVSFDFKADPEKVYAVIGQIAPKIFNKKTVELKISNLNVFAQIID